MNDVLTMLERWKLDVKAVRLFIQQRFGRQLCRSSCLNYLHRLGFVLKRPKKRLLKADAEKQSAEMCPAPHDARGESTGQSMDTRQPATPLW